ncbi:hypothetical protein [Microbispora amethystogenes]|uniref:Uncharacterized protein n=1 Tax=Microbispora amethystogenes TaxID=1427754 RepID=A0ABQ4FFQ2_9ACTN|nr:hypothetical protein [Microbispora amethystogenes]GIH33637.1 hypothetical protein Mam01_38010 [Microbispora amethystogenes]
MIAFSLGLCWLVLTPVSVWLIFGRGHRGALRAAGALTLAALQTATIALGFAQRPGAVPAQTVAVRDPGAATPGQDEPDEPSGQGGRSGQETPGGPAGPAPSPVSPPPALSGGPACDQRVATPDAVRLSFRGRALHGLTVYWPATTGQCDTATVAVHQAGHRLRIWVQEGAEGESQEGTHRVPIRVEGGVASLSLRLSPVARHHHRYVAIDGHTGDRIPLRSPMS